MKITDLPKMIAFLNEHKQISILLGSRFLGEKPENMPIIRKFILLLGILFTKIISGISLTDTHNGYRVMRKNILQKMRITMDGMGHASEILDIIAREKIPFREFPVKIVYTDYSLHKGQSGSNGIKIALRMIFKKLF